MASSEETPLFHWHFTDLNNNDSKVYNRGLFLLLIFFCIIILTTALFLYTHWVCRSRRVSSATSDHTSPEIASQASLGLDSETIDSLPIILVTANTVDGVVIETECSICLSMFEDKEKVKVLPQCNHAYHSECVDKWLSSQSSCPLCRASLHVETAHGKSSV